MDVTGRLGVRLCGSERRRTGSDAESDGERTSVAGGTSAPDLKEGYGGQRARNLMDRHEHRVVRVRSGDLRWCLFPKVSGVNRNCVALVAAAHTLRRRSLVVTVGGRGPVRVAPGPAQRRGVWRQCQSQHDPENGGSKHVNLSPAYYKTRASVCCVRARLLSADRGRQMTPRYLRLRNFAAPVPRSRRRSHSGPPGFIHH